MSHEWPCRCPKCRSDEAVDLALEGNYYHPWKQDQADIDAERYERETDAGASVSEGGL